MVESLSWESLHTLKCFFVEILRIHSHSLAIVFYVCSTIIQHIDRHSRYILWTTIHFRLIVGLKAPNKTNKFTFQTNEWSELSNLSLKLILFLRFSHSPHFFSVFTSVITEDIYISFLMVNFTGKKTDCKCIVNYECRAFRVAEFLYLYSNVYSTNYGLYSILGAFI